MADGWEYALLYLNTDGGGVWSGRFLIEGEKARGVIANNWEERLTTFNRLGREGWEVVSQSADGSANGPSRSYVYGWQWLLKRPL